jgi:hypothetical protein
MQLCAEILAVPGPNPDEGTDSVIHAAGDGDWFDLCNAHYHYYDHLPATAAEESEEKLWMKFNKGGMPDDLCHIMPTWRPLQTH